MFAAFLLAAAVPPAIALPTSTDAATERIRREIARLRRESATISAAGAGREVVAESKETLDGAERSLATGRIYRALEDLGRVSVRLHALSNTLRHGPNDGPAFESAWTDRRAALLAGEAERRLPTEAPVAIEALAQTAAAQVMIVADASRAYARVTGPRSGFYYLGEAEGDAAWSRWCRALGLRREAAEVPLRSIAPELAALSEREQAAFQPPLSIDAHPRFIELNATVKLARELDARGFRAGALYQYLDALEQLSAILPERASAPPESAEAWRKRFEASGRDESLGLLFLDRAAAAGGTRAAAILGEVLPAYTAALASARGAPAAGTAAVTVTLVRWPYT